MAKILLLGIFVCIAVLSLQECGAIKCYSCQEPCEPTPDKEKTCGENVGSSQDAFCTSAFAKDFKDPTKAVRRCQIVAKGTEPTCPPNTDCTICKSDLCNGNAAPSITANVALVGLIVAFVASRFVLN